MAIKAIIFDLDGILIDSVDAHFDAFVKAARQHGMKATKDDMYRYNGMNTKVLVRKTLKEQKVKINVLKLLFTKKQLRKEIYKRIKIFPDTISCLKKLDKYALAVATSAPKKYMKKYLKEYDLSQYFQATVNSNDVKETKPAPDVFLAAAKKLGVKPSECVVVEDAHNGIIAAHQAGMKSVAVLTSTPKKYFVGEGKPNVFLKRLAQLTPAIIKRLE